MDSIQVAINNIPETSEIWNIVVSVCAVFNIVIVTFMLLATRKYTKVTEEIFLASQRPYIGKEKHIIMFDENNKVIRFSNIIKNYGSVPAKKVSCKIKMLIKGKLEKIDGGESSNQIFFPQETHSMDLILNLHKQPNAFYAIVNGELPLELTMEIEYYGATKKKYSTTETEIYNHTIKTFVKEVGEWT